MSSIKFKGMHESIDILPKPMSAEERKIAKKIILLKQTISKSYKEMNALCEKMPTKRLMYGMLDHYDSNGEFKGEKFMTLGFDAPSMKIVMIADVEMVKCDPTTKSDLKKLGEI